MLSLKTAQYDHIYDKIRQDPWIAEHINKLPATSIINYIQESYQCAETQAEEISKMLMREHKKPEPDLSLRTAQGEQKRDNFTTIEVEQWAKNAEIFIKQQAAQGGFHSPTESLGALDELKEQSVTYLNMTDEVFAKFWAAVQGKLAAKGVVPESAELEGAMVGGKGKPEMEPTTDVPEGEASLEQFAKEVETLPMLTSDYVLDLYEKAKKIKSPKARQKALEQVKQLSTKLAMLQRFKRQAQAKQIVIPPTADNPVSRTIPLPEDTKEPPPPGKVPIQPTSPDEKKDVVSESIDDEQKTRQEQLANSFRAMEVVLRDFVKAMYGLELSHEYMGKLIEAIIDKASDLAAQQTADTVKQLASPYIGE